jgi:hypothetical protein
MFCRTASKYLLELLLHSTPTATATLRCCGEQMSCTTSLSVGWTTTNRAQKPKPMRQRASSIAVRRSLSDSVRINSRRFLAAFGIPHSSHS